MSIKTVLFALVATALMAGPCIAEDGKSTLGYLKQDQDTLIQTECMIKVLTPPVSPEVPKFTQRTTPRDRSRALKLYRASEIQYLTNMMEWSDRFRKLMDQLQNNLSDLDSQGVDPIAVSFVTNQETVIGDLIQLQIKLRGWAAQQQADLQKPHSPNLAIPEFIIGVVELAHGLPRGLKHVGVGMADEKKRNIEKAAAQAVLTDLADSFRDSSNKLSSDSAVLKTTRSELLIVFKARYPNFGWRELFPSSNNDENVEH